MNPITQKNYVSLGIALLGALKLTAEAFGYHIITDDQINSLANLAAITLTIAGIVMTHQTSKGTETETKGE